MTLIIFDLETTGLSPRRHEIIQIAAVRVEVGNWEQTAAFETFVKPQGPVPSFITHLTGITQSQVDTAPSVTDALMRFSHFAGEGTTLVAHNGLRFDLPFIRESCARAAMAVRETQVIDSRSLSRQLWGGRGGHGLDAIMDRLGLTTNGQHRHDARADVQVLAAAVQRMWNRLASATSGCPVPVSPGVLPALA